MDGYPNCPIEGLNNKINPINRTTYRFRSFKNFRLRILISFKNSFYSMNYKQKAIKILNFTGHQYHLTLNLYD
ncbi:transposase [Weissella confusa]|uniref:transposase n=1 Tax=Weissella confusa TaxID=1583 RepID=UPI0022DF8F55|nr:transposase [Weissella confusa]